LSFLECGQSPLRNFGLFEANEFVFVSDISWFVGIVMMCCLCEQRS